MIARFVITFCAMLSFGSAALTQPATEAPFGLAWGTTVEQVRLLGVELKDAPVRDYGRSYVATNLPKALSDQSTTFLSFGHDDKLYRVATLGRMIENDPMGLQVKSRYSDLKEALEEKYGRGRSTHVLGDSIYKEPRYFLSGVRGGKTFWFTSYETKDVNVELGIIASSSDDAQWRIIFSNKALSRSFDGAKKALEKKAL